MYSRDAGKWERKVWNRLIAYPDTTFHNAYPSALDLKNIMDLGNSGKSGVGEAGNEKELGVDVRGIAQAVSREGEGNTYMTCDG